MPQPLGGLGRDPGPERITDDAQRLRQSEAQDFLNVLVDQRTEMVGKDLTAIQSTGLHAVDPRGPAEPVAGPASAGSWGIRPAPATTA